MFPPPNKGREMHDENRDENRDAAGRVRLRAMEGNDRRGQYEWLLLIPLLALAYGFYTQFDQVRAMLAPDTVEVAETPPDAAPIAPTAAMPVASVPAPVTPAPAAKIQQAPAASAEPPAPVAPAPSAVVQAPPPLPALFATPAELARARTAGKAGLVEALRSGELRPATASDFSRWKTSHARNGGRNPGRSFDEHSSHMDAYVVRKDFEIPAGLSGAHAVVFLVEPLTPFPRGDAGHSPILDMESGACIGPICRMLMSEE
jgi:hypothetical protein